jgi:alkylation response protein AidB-like acyl-CoA dehydrogenase
MQQNANADFGLSEEQKNIRESTLVLLEKVLPQAKLVAMDDAGDFPFEAYDALAQAGWMGLPYPEEYGGSNLTFKDLAIFVEAVAYHSAQMASAYLTTVIYGGMHVKFGGSEALKTEIIPKIADGSIRLALCMTEPDTGSDVSAIKTKAVASGDDYVISGQKTYITCAHVADYLVVVTKTEPAAKHRGITIFLVPADAPGVTIRPLRGLGRRMIHTNEIFFDQVHVPKTSMLGVLNGGWSNLMRGLNLERLCLSAAASGNCHKIIDYARDYAVQRMQFGQPITKFQAIAHKFADMRIMAETARVMTYRVADMLDAGLDPIAETAITKVIATENNNRCADMGIQIMGGAGLMMEHPMQMYFRDSRLGTIGGGTSEIMRTVIAKHMAL